MHTVPDGVKVGFVHHRKMPLEMRLLPPFRESQEAEMMFANERPCTSFDEVIEEARAMNATGAGISPAATR